MKLQSWMDSDYKVMDLDTIEREIQNGKKSREIRSWEKDFIGGLHLLYLASVDCWTGTSIKGRGGNCPPRFWQNRRRCQAAAACRIIACPSVLGIDAPDVIQLKLRKNDLLCDILEKLSKFSIWQLFIFQNCPNWKFCQFEWR